MAPLRSFAIKLLERHPYGYAAGVFMLDHFDALLPHEADYWGFAVLASAFDFNPKVIIDLGANRGHSARAFLKILPDWQVVSFEANAMHERRLATIAARFPDRFSFSIAAITDAPKGELEFYTPVYRGVAMHSCGALSFQEALNGVQGSFPAQKGVFEIVRTVTPTTSIDSVGLDASFVKLDIQGEELNALKGMESLLTRCKPALLVEMNLIEETLSWERDQLVEFLTGLGYQPWSFDTQARTFARGWSDMKVTRNQFFIHASVDCSSA
jgi:FkbM family methyltransferase